MNSVRLFSLILFSISILLMACEDFFEVDLSGKSVSLIAPSNGVVSDVLVQTFWWEELDGATEYELQVVATRFDSIVQVIVDTTISGTQFEQSLSPGMFEWRVRGLNSAYASEYSVYSLTIDSTADLSSQTIVLADPINGSYSNQLTQTFTWQTLFLADSYRLQISSDGFASGADVLDTTVNAETASVSLPDELTYSWRVRGETETSVSSYSDVWDFSIDTTAPGAVSLLLPADNDAFVAQTFQYNWQILSDNGSPLYDSLYVYEDSLVTLFDSFESVTGNVTDSVGSGTYFWRVKTLDEAGNSGAYSEPRKFTVF